MAIYSIYDKKTLEKLIEKTKNDIQRTNAFWDEQDKLITSGDRRGDINDNKRQRAFQISKMQNNLKELIDAYNKA